MPKKFSSYYQGRPIKCFDEQAKIDKKWIKSYCFDKSSFNLLIHRIEGRLWEKISEKKCLTCKESRFWLS